MLCQPVRSWLTGLLLALLAALVSAPADAQSSELPDGVDENAPAPVQFVQTWQAANALADQSQRIVALWQDFADRHGDSALGDVARLNQMLWMLRESEQHTDDAMQLLEAWPAPDEQAQGRRATPLYRHAYDASRVWLARLKMRGLAGQLQKYYAEHVEYPPTLQTLVDAGLATREQLIDPLGNPYAYSVGTRRIMPDIPRQTYTLRCTTVDAQHGEAQGILKNLTQPMRDVQISSLAPEQSIAYVREREDDGGWGSVWRWTVGRQRADRQLWAVYDDYILVGRSHVPRVIRLNDEQEQ